MMNLERRSGNCLKAMVFVGIVGLAATCGFAADTGKIGDGVRTVYLIRHGDYDHEDDRDSEVGKELLPLGVAQARILASRLRGMPVDFSSLHSSTMTRARQTAMVIGAEFPDLVIMNSRLIRECTPPTRRKDIMRGERPESLMACRRQLEKAFSTFFAPSRAADAHDIVVCHGNVIRYFVMRALGVDAEAWLGLSIGNCSLTTISVEADGSMKLLCFSDIGHLPPNLVTRTSPGEPRDLTVPGGITMTVE